MIEKIVLDYLDKMIPEHIYMEIPESSTEPFVVVQKTGSGQRNKVNSAMITLQSYAKTMLEAAKLNESVKRAMEGITVLDSIGRVSLNSDYNFTDTSTKKYRYQAVYDITHY